MLRIILMMSPILCLPFTAVVESEEGTTDLSSLTIQELISVPVSIVTRTEQTVASSPSSVTVYTRQEIQNMGIETLDNLMNFVPGVYSN